MATAYIGQIHEFNPDIMKWDIYMERAETFFEANGIDEDNKKRAILLTSVGDRTYTLLRNLCAPKKPTEQSWAEVKKLLSTHYMPQVNPIVERCKFYERKRQPGESVANFLAQLRALADKCDFENHLSVALRDRLISGINDDRMQRRLLSEPYKDLTLNKAVDICNAMESAANNVERLHTSSTTSPSVNALTDRKAVQHKKKSNNNKNAIQPHKGNCLRCGDGSHHSDSCKHKETKCNYCGKVGHLQKVCFKKQRDNGSRNNGHSNYAKKVHNIDEDVNTDSYDTVFSIQGQENEFVPPVKKIVYINNKTVEFEVDTGSGVTLMSLTEMERLNLNLKLTTTDKTLLSYAGHGIKVVGKTSVYARINRKGRKLPLYIVDGLGPNLLGRYWMKLLELHIPRIHAIDSQPTTSAGLHQILLKHDAVFEPGLGKFNGPKVHLQVDPNVPPVFCKPRPVPYALRERVNKEIDRLQQLGVLRPITHANWAAPLVPIVKSDKQSIRLCGDYKVTLNKAIVTDQYIMPKAEDIFARLAGGKVFCKLDMSEAYTQLVLDEESASLAAVNTPKGLFAVTRLPYGVSSGPAIFQRHLDNLLRHIPQAAVYIDDVILSAENETEMLQILDTVLTLFEEAKLRLKKEKCYFMQPSVTYLGHQIDKDGLRPTADKIAAIQDAPRPTNVTELRSFIGLLTFYTKFIPQQATILAPLYSLLQNDAKWEWNDIHDRAFEDAKQALINSSLLVHFDQSLPVVVSCDASPVGIGAVLANVIDGVERPVMFISRSLSKAERNYSQLEREGLSLVFAVTRLRQYLLGRHFVIWTDHKPLLSLFDPDKRLPPVAASRILRWSLVLSGYQYVLQYRRGEANGNADFFSRLPLATEAASENERRKT